MNDELPSLTLRPIGVLRTPFKEKVDAPRQGVVKGSAQGEIVLFAGRGFEHALCDLDGWERIWVITWFHRNEGWRPKVLPPRSGGARRGVFSTRSPHRPNPLGLSALRLDRVEGLSVFVRDVDALDGTPVLDIKPYVPYADAFPLARTGWLATETPVGEGVKEVADPEPGYDVQWSDLAQAQADFLREKFAVELVLRVEAVLQLGPQPHPYRRIRKDGDAFVLAVKEWRARFRVDARRITVEKITTGYRASQLATDSAPGLDAHRALVNAFR